MSAPIPARIGPYRVLARIGRGGLGEVFLVESYGASGFVRRVAVKRLIPELADQPELERALVREGVVGGLLRHRGLVQVIGLGVDAGQYHVVMEWIDGVELAALVARGPLPRPLALLVAEELALALDYVHRARDLDDRPLGLVHRDVGAANVLVSREGEVKLVDLGLVKATQLADRTRGDQRKGTYAYMSPEQVAGEPLTPASDVFALGVLIAELLTGQRPFDRATPLATMDAIRAAELPAWPDLVGDDRDLLARCLAAAPEDRWSSDPLRAALAVARRGATASIAHLAAWVSEHT
jgi:eukaryotic-like serine/threonine-protein kinase